MPEIGGLRMRKTGKGFSTVAAVSEEEYTRKRGGKKTGEKHELGRQKTIHRAVTKSHRLADIFPLWKRPRTFCEHRKT